MKRLLTLIAILLGFFTVQAQINGGKKLLIVVTSSDHPINDPMDNTWGCYLPEVADFYGVAHQYGFKWDDIDIVSPMGGKVPVILIHPSQWGTKLNDDEIDIMFSKLDATLKPAEVNPESYNVIYFAGGYSCLVDFPSATNIGNIAAKIYEKGGKVGAVCDGISGLIPIKLSNGKFLVDGVKVITNNYNKANDKIDVAEDLAKNGAIVTKKSPYYFADKNVVTGQDVRPVEVTTELMKLLGINIWPMNVAAVNKENDLQCYPNPAHNLIHVNLPLQNEKATYTIYGVNGQAVLNNKKLMNNTIDLAELPIGAFMLDILADGKHFVANITKE